VSACIAELLFGVRAEGEQLEDVAVLLTAVDVQPGGDQTVRPGADGEEPEPSP
jgi:hypothetical protein